MRARVHGFTLVELLAVVGAIAVLAAVLAPVLLGAKASAMRAKCQSNLRQIAKAFEAYLGDYDSCYPCKADDPATPNDESDPQLWMGRHWRWPMQKYLKFTGVYDSSSTAGANQITAVAGSILTCPADPTPVEQYDKTSYGYSFAFYHRPEQMDRMSRANTLAKSEPDPELRPRVIGSGMVRYPSKKALVAEWLAGHSNETANWWTWTGARNYLFADGHVKYLAARSIKPSAEDLPDINLTIGGVAGRDVD